MAKFSSLAVFHFFVDRATQPLPCQLQAHNHIPCWILSHCLLSLQNDNWGIVWGVESLCKVWRKIFIMKFCSSKSDPSLWISTKASWSKVIALPMERSPQPYLASLCVFPTSHLIGNTTPKYKIDATLSWAIISIDPKTMNSQRCSAC